MVWADTDDRAYSFWRTLDAVSDVDTIINIPPRAGTLDGSSPLNNLRASGSILWSYQRANNSAQNYDTDSMEVQVAVKDVNGNFNYGPRTTVSVAFKGG